MMIELFPSKGNEAANAMVNSINSLNQLLELNASIDQARAQIESPFTITANRVTEVAQPRKSVD